MFNCRYQVVVTARSEDKGRRIVESIPEETRDRVSYVVIDDVAKEGAFDTVSVLSESISS
jgi:hypothetical protein